MKTKSTGLTLQDLGNKSFTIKTPSNQINLHCLLVACGKSKSGKGFFITNLLHQLKQAGSMDRIFLVSDTAKSNKKMLERLKIDEDDIFPTEDDSCIDEIINRIEKERDDLVEYRERLKLFEQFKSYMEDARFKDLDEITPEMLLFFNPETGEFEKPKHRYNGKKPVIGIFFDDVQSTPIMASKRFRNLAIKARHVGAFDSGETPLGCSLFIAIQNWSSVGQEGVPKSIQGNLTCCAIYKTGNWKELELLTTELSGVIPKNEIMKHYDYVMNVDPKNRHNFLFVDLFPKKEHPSPFRLNYVDFIVD